MIALRNRNLGRILLGIAFAAWTLTSVIIFTEYENGAPIWVLLLSATGFASGVLGAYSVARSKGTFLGLLITFLFTGLPFIVGLTLIKTGWAGDPNIGVGGILFLGYCLQPVSAAIAVIALIVDVVKSPK